MHEARRRVDACRQAAAASSQGLTDQLAALTRSKDAILAEVATLRARLVELVMHKEEQAIQKIETTYSRHRDLLTRRVRSCDVGNSALGKTCQFLDNLIALGNDVDILKNFDTVVKHVNELEREKFPTYQKTLSTVLKFTPEKKTTEFLKNTSAIGDIKVAKENSRQTAAQTMEQEKKSTVSTPAKKTLKKSVPVQQKAKETSADKLPALNVKQPPTPRPKVIASFSGRDNSDTMKTDLREIVSLADGSVVVMDIQFRNKRLKKFNPRGKLTSHIDPGDCPASLALLPDSDLVVALSTAKELVIVAGAGTLVIKNRHKTTKSYFSLAASTDGVIAAVVPSQPDGPCIDLLSVSGEILHSLPLDRIRFPSPPRGITLTHCGLIYIIFSGPETLIGMTMRGDITLSFKSSPQHSICRPVSIECDDQDNAYIADTDNSKVHVVSGTGQYQGELLTKRDGLREPRAVCRMEEGGLAVTQANGEIKVFAVQALP